MKRQVTVLAFVAPTVILMACSTFVDIAGLPHTGAQINGTYVPTNAEKSLDCSQLKVQVTSQIDRTKEISIAVPEDKRRGPKTVASLFAQITGTSSRGVKTIAEYDNARMRARTLNEVMRSKHCPTVDIDAELRETDLIVAAARG